MKLLSLLAILFLPVSTVSTIFATPFFHSGTIATERPGLDSPGREHVMVNPEIWWLCAATLPITLAILAIWLVWDNRERYGMAVGRFRLKRDAFLSVELGRAGIGNVWLAGREGRRRS